MAPPPKPPPISTMRIAGVSTWSCDDGAVSAMACATFPHNATYFHAVKLSPSSSGRPPVAVSHAFAANTARSQISGDKTSAEKVLYSPATRGKTWSNTFWTMGESRSVGPGSAPSQKLCQDSAMFSGTHHMHTAVSPTAFIAPLTKPDCLKENIFNHSTWTTNLTHPEHLQSQTSRQMHSHTLATSESCGCPSVRARPCAR